MDTISYVIIDVDLDDVPDCYLYLEDATGGFIFKEAHSGRILGFNDEDDEEEDYVGNFPILKGFRRGVAETIVQMLKKDYPNLDIFSCWKVDGLQQALNESSIVYMLKNRGKRFLIESMKTYRFQDQNYLYLQYHEAKI